jgi:hypothetical protein
MPPCLIQLRALSCPFALMNVANLKAVVHTPPLDLCWLCGTTLLNCKLTLTPNRLVVDGVRILKKAGLVNSG